MVSERELDVFGDPLPTTEELEFQENLRRK